VHQVSGAGEKVEAWGRRRTGRGQVAVADQCRAGQCRAAQCRAAQCRAAQCRAGLGWADSGGRLFIRMCPATMPFNCPSFRGLSQLNQFAPHPEPPAPLMPTLPACPPACQVPALSPRQLKLLGQASLDREASAGVAATAQGMIQEIPREYLLKRLGGLVGKRWVS